MEKMRLGVVVPAFLREKQIRMRQKAHTWAEKHPEIIDYLKAKAEES